MSFLAAQRIFSTLIVLALVAGTPVRFDFPVTTEVPLGICAGAQMSAEGCCSECGEEDISIDACAPQCAAFAALSAIYEAVPLPWYFTASDRLLPGARLWSAETESPPPKLLSRA
tara:strand:+ start:174 stop:518 length:345 start_codon:yes stop_codon:yes gene_type:complete